MDIQIDQEAVRQELAELYRNYVRRLPEKLEIIRRIARALHTGMDTVEILEELHAQAHKLAGSAGTYGCPEVGKAARDYENLIIAQLESGIESGPEDYQQLETRFGELEMAVDHTVKSTT